MNIKRLPLVCFFTLLLSFVFSSAFAGDGGVTPKGALSTQFFDQTVRSLRASSRSFFQSVITTALGERIFVSDRAYLPTSLSSGAWIGEFSGYIVELPELSLIEKQTQLQAVVEYAEPSLKAEATPLPTQASKEFSALLKNQRVLIEREQLAAEKIIGQIAKNAKITQRYLKAINGFSVQKLSEEEARMLEGKGYRLTPDYRVRAVLMDSVPLVSANKVWNEIKDKQGSFVTGKGVRVGVIDTGIDYSHADFGSCAVISSACKVAGGFDFVNWDADPKDDNGHGTHVASIVASKGVVKGVAPDATLYAYKVLDRNGFGSVSAILAGIERSIDPNLDGDFSDKLDVINLSLGGLGDPDDAFSRAIDRVSDAGVVVVVAAGNEGMYGDKTIMSPGVARKAITVAATEKNDVTAYFSSRGPVIWKSKTILKPDIAAPGHLICAARMSGFEPWVRTSLYAKCVDEAHVLLSGTSMAAPHVAGAAALLRQSRPSWTSRQIKSALKSGAHLLLPPQQVGTGRLDAYATLSYTEAPPIAELEPLSLKYRDSLSIMGRVNAARFSKYTLEYAPYGTSDFTLIKQVQTSTLLGVVQRLGELDLNALADGAYLIRLSVFDVSGKKAVDYGYTEVRKLEITFPQNLDILRGGVKIAVSLKSPLGSVPSLSYGAGNSPSSWTPFSGLIFDTTSLSSGVYTLRVQLARGSGFDEVRSTFYLDRSLRSGFPKRVAYDKASDNSHYQIGEFAPVVSDLDGDGKKEIVLVRESNSPELIAYRSNGTLLWQKTITDMNDGFVSEPLVVDMNGDGKKEIFVAVFGRWNNLAESYLYSFGFDGQPYSDFPQPYMVLPKNQGYALLAADLNLDGKPEIILQPGSGIWESNYPRTLLIVGSGGKVMLRKQLISSAGFWTGRPAVGNFDDDVELEVVVLSPIGYGPLKLEATYDELNHTQIDILNLDGSSISKSYPLQTLGFVYGSPAVADVNGDGKEDLVVPTVYSSEQFPDFRYGGLYVFDRNGAVLSGFPIRKGYNFMSSPAIFDVEGDGKPEIAASELGFVTQIVNSDGTIRSGWPKGTCWNDYGGLIVADVSGDGKKDVVTTSGNYWCNNGPIGGVYGFNSDGSVISGFPKPTEIDAQAPAVVTDLDGNGTLEIVATSNWDFDIASRRYKNRGSVYVWDTAQRYDASSLDWPMRRRDEWKTGRYSFFSSSSPSSTLPALDLRVTAINPTILPVSSEQDFDVNVIVRNDSTKAVPLDALSGASKASVMLEILDSTSTNASVLYRYKQVVPGSLLPHSTTSVFFSHLNVSNDTRFRVLNVPTGSYVLRATAEYEADLVPGNNVLFRPFTAVDKTPRIAYWYGKVNQFVATTTWTWLSDPDEQSGANLDKLNYCKKWYPATLRVEPYKSEMITGWSAGVGSSERYIYSVMTDRCVERSLHLKRSMFDDSYPSTVISGQKNVVFLKFVLSAPESDVTFQGFRLVSDSLNATDLRNVRVLDQGGKELGRLAAFSPFSNGFATGSVTTTAITISKEAQEFTLVADLAANASFSYRVGVQGFIFSKTSPLTKVYGTTLWSVMRTVAGARVTPIPPVTTNSQAGAVAHFFRACIASGGNPEPLEYTGGSTYTCERFVTGQSSLFASMYTSFGNLIARFFH